MKWVLGTLVRSFPRATCSKLQLGEIRLVFITEVASFWWLHRIIVHKNLRFMKLPEYGAPEVHKQEWNICVSIVKTAVICRAIIYISVSNFLEKQLSDIIWMFHSMSFLIMRSCILGKQLEINVLLWKFNFFGRRFWFQYNLPCAVGLCLPLMKSYCPQQSSAYLNKVIEICYLNIEQMLA